VDARGVTTGWIVLPPSRYGTEEQQRTVFDEILRRVQAVPGVTSAALTSALPLAANAQAKYTFEGHPRPKGQEPLIETQVVTPDYFRTLGMRVLAGRGFGPTDVHGGAPVVWIDDVLAKKYFPGEDPVGKWIVHGPFDSTEPKTVVAGVVNAVHDQSLDAGATGIVYAPFDQQPWDRMAVTVKTSLPFEQVMPDVRRAIASVDKQLPLANERTMEAVISETIGQDRFTLLVLGVFALVALSLAAVGVYGVIAYYVAQRSREFGIRVALGAQRASIGGLVARRVLAAAGTGTLIGLALAAAASGLLAKLLFGIRPTDAPTYAGCAVLLLAVALLAALVPAWRAARVSPAEVMRAE
jgi:predicted permease